MVKRFILRVKRFTIRVKQFTLRVLRVNKFTLWVKDHSQDETIHPIRTANVNGSAA